MTARASTSPLPARAHGFSLIELLAAVAVFSILIVVLFGVLDAATRLWQTSERRVDSFREVRAALNVLRGDIANAVMLTNNPANTNRLLPYVQTNQIAFLMRLPPLQQTLGGTNTAANPGDVVFVCYTYDAANAALLRQLVPSGPTFSNLLASSGTSLGPNLFNSLSASTTETLATNVSFLSFVYSSSPPTLLTAASDYGKNVFPSLLSVVVGATDRDATWLSKNAIEAVRTNLIRTRQQEGGGIFHFTFPR